jgi:hypothetical protein
MGRPRKLKDVEDKNYTKKQAFVSLERRVLTNPD